MDIVELCMVGLFAGWFPYRFAPGPGFGPRVDFGCGVVGACIGGTLLRWMKYPYGDNPLNDAAHAAVTAWVLLFVVRAFALVRRRVKARRALPQERARQ